MTCLIDTFTTGQIDNMQLGMGANILADSATFYIDDEYAMGAGGGIILGSLRYHTVCITYEEKVKGILFSVSSVH